MITPLLLLFVFAQIVVGEIICGAGQTYARLLMHCEAACNEQAVSILSGSEVVYLSPMYIEYVDSDTETCLKSSVNNLYTMNFTDTQNDGWYPGSFLIVYGKYGNIFYKYYQVSPTYETHLLSLHYAFNLNEVWKISESYYPGWNTYWFDDSAWSEEQLGVHFGNYLVTQYFRKPFAARIARFRKKLLGGGDVVLYFARIVENVAVAIVGYKTMGALLAGF